MKLTDYMKKIEGIYKDAAAEYIKLAKKHTQTYEDVQKVQGSRELTHEGKQKRIADIEAYRRELAANMDAIAADADQKAMKVRADVADRFYSKFHATAAAMDMQAIELMKSGILTDAELRTLAGTFNGNPTMLRICGTYLEKSKDADTARLGRALQFSAGDPHLDCIDNIIAVGRACVGKGTASGPSGAENQLRHFDTSAANVYASAPDVDA